MICTLAWFQLRDQRPFEVARTARFDPQTRAAGAEAWLRDHSGSVIANTRATVVHLFTAECPCNRFTDPHRADIAARYAPQGVRFLTAAASELDLDWIDATPAALVYDASGRLVYFGPYSDAARCAQSGGLVEKVLDRVLTGDTPQLQAFYGGGCFCGRSASA